MMKKRYRQVYALSLLACTWILFSPQTAQAQVGGMTCLECHADPLAGGFHGGFRNMSVLTEPQVEIICLSCHDGSYTNPQGIQAPEAAVHQNKNPGAGRDQYGDFKASCLDCHHTHTALLAGDGTTSTLIITTDPNIDETHDVDITTTSFLLDERLVTASTIVIADDTGAAFAEGVDYQVSTMLIGGRNDPIKIVIVPGGAISVRAPITVHVAYQFGTNQQLLGRLVKERNSTDGLARIRRPIIVDTNGDNNGTGQQRFKDDVHTGWACSSAIPDDPTCLPDDVREVIFHDQIKENGTNWAPTIVDFGPPTVTTGPRNGACNSCHTRTGQHRRNDLHEFGGGDNHEHNVDKNCDQCHFHRNGWVNKGG